MKHTQAGERVRFGGYQEPHRYVFELTGGRLCLDLANTLDERNTDHPRDLLSDYQRVIDWAVQAGAISETEYRSFRTTAKRDVDAARVALEELVELREVLFQIFSAVARHRPVPGSCVAALNRFVMAAAARRQVVSDGGGFRWVWDVPSAELFDRLLSQVAWSAAELMTSPDLQRVRQCHGSGCEWLFIDTSKNGSRRWCDMSVCGNRAKARRHYAKSKKY